MSGALGQPSMGATPAAGAMPGAPPGGAGGPPAAMGGGPPGQPPFGSSPVTQPTPSHGNQAGGLAIVAVMLRLAETALPMVSAATPLGKTLLKFMSDMGKHVPNGAGSAGVQDTALQQLQNKQKQDAPMLALLRAQQQGGQQQGSGVATPPPEPGPQT